jgi:NAD(P)-dependent dehydrogenase (short-subunit alcohol dehydrogenase family)
VESVNSKCESAAAAQAEPQKNSIQTSIRRTTMTEQQSLSKIALVTGAGSGIGRAVALGLLEDGYKVVVTGRRIEPLEELVALAREQGGEALAVSTDVRDPASVDKLFATIEEVYGRLDVVFNNAGVNAPAVPMDELPVEKWLSVIDTNVTGVFLCSRGAFGLMRKQSPQGGRIINNGSISAHVPRPFTGPYTASKHAVLGLTKSLALDGREFNIACSQIDIGNALTELSVRMTKGVRQANGSIAVEPMIDVKHIADAVRYISALPLSANVLNMTVMATNMPFVGRG